MKTNLGDKTSSWCRWTVTLWKTIRNSFTRDGSKHVPMYPCTDMYPYLGSFVQLHVDDLTGLETQFSDPKKSINAVII